MNTKKHLIIVDECRVHPICPKIYVDEDDGVAKCLTYLDPAAVQCRFGKKDACAIKPRPVETKKAKTVIKRKFGKKTR
jgi:hypothetical protein